MIVNKVALALAAVAGALFVASPGPAQALTIPADVRAERALAAGEFVRAVPEADDMPNYYAVRSLIEPEDSFEELSARAWWKSFSSKRPRGNEGVVTQPYSPPNTGSPPPYSIQPTTWVRAVDSANNGIGRLLKRLNNSPNLQLAQFHQGQANYHANQQAQHEGQAAYHDSKYFKHITKGQDYAEKADSTPDPSRAQRYAGKATDHSQIAQGHLDAYHSHQDAAAGHGDAKNWHQNEAQNHLTAHVTGGHYP